MDFHLSDLADGDVELLEFDRDRRWLQGEGRHSPAYEFMNGAAVH